MASNVANAACLAVPRAVHLRRSHHLRTDAHCTTAFSGTPVRVQKSVILRQPPLFLCGSLRRQTTGNVARVARDSLLFLFPDCSYMLVISIARLVFLRRILPRPARDWDFRGRRPGCHACLLFQTAFYPLACRSCESAGEGDRQLEMTGLLWT
jgi:hypothetical protein